MEDNSRTHTPAFTQRERRLSSIWQEQHTAADNIFNHRPSIDDTTSLMEQIAQFQAPYVGERAQAARKDSLFDTLLQPQKQYPQFSDQPRIRRRSSSAFSEVVHQEKEIIKPATPIDMEFPHESSSKKYPDSAGNSDQYRSPIMAAWRASDNGSHNGISPTMLPLRPQDAINLGLSPFTLKPMN